MTAATMPREWVRGPQWASEQARAEWEPVLRRAQAAWSELELASVTEHLRASALVHLDPGEITRASREASGMGLALTILEEKSPGAYRAAVHWPGPLAAQWHRAWAGRDDETIGRMLGFPACCRAFFARTWGAGSCDPTPGMETVSGPWEANTLLRQLGVRLAPHLPCSASCEATAAQARAFLEVGRRAGFDVGAIEALLRLPATYSALAGVAIVETPHFRFMAGADPEAVADRERAASEQGESARFGRRGNGASLCPPPSVDEPEDRVPSEPAFAGRHTPRVPGGLLPGALDGQCTPWQDNGFPTEAAMLAAHSVVIEAADRAAPIAGLLLDLGCGDGRLLSVLGNRWPGSDPCGIDADMGRIERGRLRHPGVQLLHRTIERMPSFQESGESWSLVLLMPGRLLEMAPQQAAAVREVLARRAARLLLYSYNGGLADLAARAGFTLGPIVSGPGAEAALGEVRP